MLERLTGRPANNVFSKYIFFPTKCMRTLLNKNSFVLEGVLVMNLKYIGFFEEYVGPDWLKTEFDRINTKTPLKGIGNHFSNYHPWVHYMYELRYLVHRADIEGRSTLLMGRYHHILSNAGMLLARNIGSIPDRNDAINRLRHPDQFYDFIWELEVKTMLEINGASVRVIAPSPGISYDGIACIDGFHIPYECKNKILDNSQHDSNMIFAQVLTKRLENEPCIENKVVEFEFVDGRLEDIRSVISSIRNVPVNQNVIEVLGRYKIRFLPPHLLQSPAQELIDRPGVEFVIETRKCSKRDIFNIDTANAEEKAKLLFKMPSANTSVKNLKAVLKKANSQLSCGGVVFIQLPYLAFEQGVREIAQILSNNLSNISAVKAVALDYSNVKVSRKEKLVIPTNCKYRLPDNVIDFLSQPMIFSKYAEAGV